MKNNNIKKYADIATIGNTAARCREEGIPVGKRPCAAGWTRASSPLSTPGVRFWCRGKI